MSRIARFGVFAILLSGLTVGCTTTSTGEPRPEDTQTQSSDAPDQSTTSEEQPERPREIKLDGVDPCTLIQQADYPDYYLEKSGKLEQDETFNSAECAWDGTEIGYFSITLVTTEGIEGWQDGSKSAKAEKADPISGFPALTITNPNDNDVCFVAVDVAEGQQLLAQVGLDLSRPDDLPPICEYTHQFAASAMSTLVES